MGIYTKLLNEEYLIESQLDSIGLSKDELTDKNKVRNVLEKDKNGKKRSVKEKIETVFVIIGIIIIGIPAALTAPIWFPLFCCIDNAIDSIKDKRKNNLIDKTCNEYQKSINKLNSKLAKAEGDEKNEIEKSINQFKSEIDKLQKKKIDDVYVKKIKKGLNIINEVKNCKDFPDDDYALSAFWLYYNNISQKEFESKYSKVSKDALEYFKEEDNKELFDYFNKYKNDKWDLIYIIDDTIFLYNLSKHQFFYGDWDPKWITCKSFEDFKNHCKVFFKEEWEDIEEADQYLGYYRITKAPEGVDPIK